MKGQRPFRLWSFSNAAPSCGLWWERGVQGRVPRGPCCAPSLLTWPRACGGYTGSGDGGLALVAGG